MFLKQCLSFLTGLICLPILLFAQETTSEIHGLVTDGQTGIPGAAIVALHTPTGTKYMTTTRKDGRYNVPNVRVGGPYVITVSYLGFQEQQIPNITLSLGQEFTGDFILVPETKQLNEIVVKSGKQDKTFNNNRTGSQEIISRDQLEKLPTINRSAQDFTRLEPTASTTIGGQSFGGRSNQYNNFTVDGANFNNSFGLSGTLGGQTSAQPISLDAIDQIQVNVSPYDVRQGGFSGAGINTVTKSGTNQLKATVYTYIKGAGTQGYKVGTTEVPKTDLSFNIRGASIGGPIIKNKVFFFVNGESSRQTLPATSWVPSGNGVAPSSANGISLANSDTLAALATFLKDNFNYDPGAYTGYSFKTNSDKITAKIDWNINDRNTVTFKYNYLRSFSDQFASASRPTGAITGGQPSYNAMPFYGSGYVINNDFNIFIAELNTRFGNSASNKLQVGYTALRDYRTTHSTSSTFPLVDILYNGNIYTSFGYEPYTYNNTLNTDVFQFSDIFTFYKGAHEITVGTQDYYRKYQNAFAPGYQGAYQFNSLTDFYNSVTNGTANARNYYLQYSALKDGSFPWANAGSTELGLFAQDKWRVTGNFTLTYGLRMDMTIYKQTFTDNPDFNALKFKDGVSYDIGKAPGNALLISPRIGFNWDVLGDKTLQVRGGAGIFSGPPPFVWISNQASNNGVQWGSFNKSNVAFNADPDAYRPTGATANTSYSVALVDKDFKYPSVIKSGLAIDKKLDDWVFTVEGTYSKDVNAVYYSNINLNQTNAYALTNGSDNRLRYNTSRTTSLNTSNKYYYSGTSLADPNIGTGILMKNTSKGYSYNITGRIQKTIGNLYMSVAYTHGDARNTAETGSTASSLWGARAVSGDPNSPNLAYASYRLPNRVIAMASYKVSYAKYFTTSFGIIFEAAPAGVTSYIYNGDLNGDGFSNDLIYIPKTIDDIKLVASGSSDLRTNAQIWAQLNNFINQDSYLSKHRGEVTKANAVVLPYYKKADVNITQDISVKTGKDRHTLRLSLDVINVGNLLNRNWGIVKATSVTNFLKFEGITADGTTPQFSFPYASSDGQIPYTNSFVNNTAITSRWQMQFGIRYLFN